jgi:hypothetical protein
MSAFIGNTQPNNYYIGNTPLSALYIGTNLIWPVGQEVAYYDFNVSASYPVTGNLNLVYNISNNRNYVSNNTTTMSLYAPTVFTDPSGSGRYAAISASYTFGVQPTNYINRNNGIIHALTASAFSFETWVRPYQKRADGNIYLSGPNHSSLLSQYGATGWSLGVSNFNTNDGSMVIINGSVTSTPVSASTGPNIVNFNQWNHLVYTVQRNATGPSTFTMYKNGVVQPIIRNNFTSNLLQGLGALQLLGVASFDVGAKYGLFDISQYKIYNKVLDGAEVLSLFQATRARYSI